MPSCRPDRFLPRRPGAWLPGALLPILWLAAGLLGALAVGAAALGATPLGSEFQVNSYATGWQRDPSVAVDADGNFVVVWQSDGSAGSDDDGESIQGQRYDAGGNALGREFQVNSYATGGQEQPSVAVDADGNFVVVWVGPEIQGQRYEASGNAVGSEFQVNNYATGEQGRPSIAVDADGDFVVVWQSDGSPGSDTSGYSIQGQRYDASGNAVGSQFQVNSYATDDQNYPSVAIDADGHFVVAWTTYLTGSFPIFPWDYDIRSQRYDASGNAVGSEFQVNTDTTAWQRLPSVAADADGDFVVVWRSYLSDDLSFFYWSIDGRRYDASGNAVGADFQVASPLVNTSPPMVGADSDGDFVVVWGGYSSWPIYGQHYDASGDAVGSQFQVNSYASPYPTAPAVAVGAGGDFVVAWESYVIDPPDYSIQARRYTTRTPLVPSLSPPGVIGLGVLLLGIAAAGLRGRLRQRR